MTNFNERTNTLLYENISLTLYSWKGDILCCVWDELETGTDCYIDPKFLFDHCSTSFSSWFGLLNRGSLRAASSQSASWFSRWCPISNWLKPSVPWLYYCLTSTCFCCSSAYCTQVHLLIDGLGRGSIYNNNKRMHQTSTENYKTRHDWVGKVIHWELWPYKQMVYVQPRICPGEWNTQTHLGYWEKLDYLITARRSYNNYI